MKMRVISTIKNFHYPSSENQSSSEEEVTDDEAEESGEEENNDGKSDASSTAPVKREWNTKEEAKQAFKELLREKVCMKILLSFNLQSLLLVISLFVLRN